MGICFKQTMPSQLYNSDMIIVSTVDDILGMEWEYGLGMKSTD